MMRGKEAQADLTRVRSLLAEALDMVNWNYRHQVAINPFGLDRDTWSALSGHLEQALWRITEANVE